VPARHGERLHWRVALAIALALATLVTTAAARQAEPRRVTRSSNEGVYSAEQAARGKVLFSDICLVCHTDPFWRPGWEGKPLADIYTKILEYMPDDNPGTLSAEETSAVLAYILNSSGVPAGEEALPTERALLEEIVVEKPAP
jgi:cytochrome c5